MRRGGLRLRGVPLQRECRPRQDSCGSFVGLVLFFLSRLGDLSSMDTARDLFFLALAAVAATAWFWRRNQAKKAMHWPLAEGIIESGAIEAVAHSKYGTIELPVFAFSYRVGTERFGGRFALRPYITDPGASVTERLIGRKLAVHYDPRNVQRWFIPDEFIEGCRVEQALSPDFVNYPPRN